MESIVTLLVLSYLLPIGFALIVSGPQGAAKVHRYAFKLVRRTLAKVVDLIGDLVKALARSIRG